MLWTPGSRLSSMKLVESYIVNVQMPTGCVRYCQVKYLKVVIGHVTGLAKDAPTQWEVWCFVDAATGDVYKPASWKAPAKHVRYNLFDEDSYNKALES